MPKFNALIVHAGLIPKRELSEQDPLEMVTMRSFILEHSDSDISDINELNNDTEPIIKKVSDSAKKGIPWARLWSHEISKNIENKTHIYFGHDAKRGYQSFEYATGLDTGACYGRSLTGIILPLKELVEIKSLHVYEEPKDKDES